MHEYKEKVKVLSEKNRACFDEYEIDECFIMDYDKFIYLCNHISERLAKAKKSHSGNSIRHVAMYFSTRADKVLLLSFADRKVAVLYNAGQKVELRHNSHRARDLRSVEKRKLRELQKLNNMI